MSVEWCECADRRSRCLYKDKISTSTYSNTGKSTFPLVTVSTRYLYKMNKYLVSWCVGFCEDLDVSLASEKPKPLKDLIGRMRGKGGNQREERDGGRVFSFANGWAGLAGSAGHKQ